MVLVMDMIALVRDIEFEFEFDDNINGSGFSFKPLNTHHHLT